MDSIFQQDSNGVQVILAKVKLFIKENGLYFHLIPFKIQNLKFQSQSQMNRLIQTYVHIINMINGIIFGTIYCFNSERRIVLIRNSVLVQLTTIHLLMYHILHIC